MKLLITEPPLTVLPSLAKEVGVNDAIVLQQLWYWTCSKKPDESGEIWVYNTLPEWRRQFPWLSSRTLQRVIDRLRDKRLIDVRQPNGNDRTNHYRVLVANVPQLQGATVTSSSRQSGVISNTSETTSEIDKGSSSKSKEVEEVWKNHEALFGTPKGKGLTPSRTRVIEKALAEFSVEELQRASIGLKRYRERKSGSTEIASAFSTNPRTGPLVERIGFWIEQADQAAPEDDDLAAEAEQIRREHGLDT